jgi:hypothetical protein
MLKLLVKKTERSSLIRGLKKLIEQAKLAEQQKRLEELIASEKEKDPDALEEDIRQQFFKAQATKRFAEQRVDETTV